MHRPLMRRLLLICGAAMGVIAAPAAAQTAAAPADTGGANIVPNSPISAFQWIEGRIFTIGWRLTQGNAAFCNNAQSASGWLLHDAAAYGDPAAVRTELGLTGDIGIQAIAPGSPAARAGLRVNDTIIALNGADIAASYPPTRPGWQRGVTIADALDAALTAGPVTITWRRGETPPVTATITGTLVCPSRFQLLDSSDTFGADGDRIVIGAKFPGLDYPEDELAAGLAHELAHNFLGHAAALKTTGRKRALIRLSERDADRLMPWLLANAGYDPEAAIRFMQRWGPQHSGGILRKRTHDGWDERVETIRAEIERMRRVTAGEAHFDWARLFTREFTPTVPTNAAPSKGQR